ncbi:MAG: hypothetical protein H6536_08995 [Bacteroidales bacterium]|nr:hypothetical protein [Bacteroidales bacterium]
MKSKLTIISIICIALLTASCTSSKKAADANTKSFRYELEAMPTGVQGTYLIKVWSYSKDPKLPMDVAKKNAVHGVIFKGFAGKPGIPGQVALVPNSSVEAEKAAYFDKFFETGGEYLKYANIASNGAIAAEDIMRVGKEYKVAMVVSINVASLRKALEAAGIIRSLDQGF